MRAAEQVGHPHQVTQSASSRLNSSPVQAGTTSRTTRAAWTATPTSSRADGTHSVQLGRAAAVSSGAGRRCDTTARVWTDGAAHFGASTGARMPTVSAPHAVPPPCGANGAGSSSLPPGLLQLAPWSERLLKAASVLHPLGMVVQLRPDGLATLCPAPAATTAAAAGPATSAAPAPTSTNPRHQPSPPTVTTDLPLRQRRHRSPCQIRRETRRRLERDVMHTVARGRGGVRNTSGFTVMSPPGALGGWGEARGVPHLGLAKSQ